MAKKHIIPNQVTNWANLIFIVQGVAGSEEEIVIQFSRATKYRVVKLDVKDLPKKDDRGKKITWVNNFGVVDARGRYVERVKYTVFMQARHKKMQFVYYQNGKLKPGKPPTPKGSKAPQREMIQRDFYTGDPGIGCT